MIFRKTNNYHYFANLALFAIFALEQIFARHTSTLLTQINLMTQDAINKANYLQSKITEAVGIKNIHLHAVQGVFKELSTADQTSLTEVLETIHAPLIATLQSQLTALDGDYTAPLAISLTDTAPIGNQ